MCVLINTCAMACATASKPRPPQERLKHVSKTLCGCLCVSILSATKMVCLQHLVVLLLLLLLLLLSDGLFRCCSRCSTGECSMRSTAAFQQVRLSRGAQQSRTLYRLYRSLWGFLPHATRVKSQGSRVCLFCSFWGLLPCPAVLLLLLRLLCRVVVVQSKERRVHHACTLTSVLWGWPFLRTAVRVFASLL